MRGTLLVLVLAVSYSSTFDDDYGDDYSEEDLDYDTYFEPYNPGTANIWDLTSVEVKNRPGPLNLKGRLRRQFVIHSALKNPEKSMVCSPISVLLTLGKLALAAEGDCLQELLLVMGLSKKNKMKKAFKPLIKNLEYLNGINLKVISKVYVSKEVRIRSKFRKRARKIFKSGVETMDFKNPSSAARKINDYVRTKTKDGILKVLSEYEISPKTSMLLVNTVFFTGYWEKPFKNVATTSFYSKGSTRPVDMMSRTGRYKYGRSNPLGAQLVEIPYEGGKTSLLVILPTRKDSLPALLEKMETSPQLIQHAAHNMYPTDIMLAIPKFKTEMTMDLNVVFKTLGLREMFNTRQSGFENIVKGGKNIHVSKSVHKAIILVTEKGTAASTGSESGVIQISLDDQNVFYANHPFLYFVLYKGEQIFAGTYVD